MAKAIEDIGAAGKQHEPRSARTREQQFTVGRLQLVSSSPPPVGREGARGHSHATTALIEPIVEASSASSSNPRLTASI